MHIPKTRLDLLQAFLDVTGGSQINEYPGIGQIRFDWRGDNFWGIDQGEWFALKGSGIEALEKMFMESLKGPEDE